MNRPSGRPRQEGRGRSGPRNDRGNDRGRFNDRGGQGRFNNRGSGRFNDAPREMHAAVCADCGTNCEVPFKPTEGRPVYCNECHAKHRPPRF